MKNPLNRSRILATAVVTAAVVGMKTPALAQEQPAEQAQRQKRIALEEVIVTAQRREESAQDVAISITVFDQEQIANANMTNAADIATYTPSMTTNTRFGNENTSFAIRGFTQDLRTAASVATYFAEVVAPRGQTSQTSGDGAGPGTLFDLENIQVLKGPQGTLFGRNTTGGAILLVPNKPGDEFEGYAEYSTGNLGQSRKQVVVNLPVTDWFKARLGVDKNERDGHLTNVTGVGADELGNTDYTAIRLSVVLDITDNLENYTIFSTVDSESNGYTSTLFDCNPNSDPSVNPFYSLTSVPCMNQLEEQRANGQDGFYDLVSTVKTPITKIKEKRVINTTTWDITDKLTIKNILAYAHLETENGSDIFGTRFPESGLLGPLADPNREFAVGVSVPHPSIPVTSQESWIEELRAQGMLFDDRLIWQAGLYYENSKPDGYSGNNSGSFLYCELGTLEGQPSQYNCFDPLNGALGGVLEQEYKTEFLNKAVYAQATYDILQQLSMTLGLRYTMDEAKGYGIKTRYTFAGTARQDPIVTISEPETDSEAPTGMVELNYRPIDGIMAYAKYTRGYRQGSVNLAADPGLDTHEHETVDTYEIGAKTEFGGPIPGRFNISYFENTLTDMQLQFGYISNTAGPTTAITNVGEAEINGFEIESMLQLWEGLTLSLSYSELDTELVEQGNLSAEKVQSAVDAAGGNGVVAAQTVTPIAEVGDELPFAPETSWVASLNYQLPLPASVGVVSVGATYVYTGEQRAAASGASPYAMLPDFELLNLNAAWLGIFGTDFDLSLYGTNVRDEEYTSYVSGVYNTLGFETRMVGFPKMYGARLRYSF